MNYKTLALITSIALNTFDVSAEQLTNDSLTKNEQSNLQLSVGGVYHKINDFEGEGFTISGQFNLDLPFLEELPKWQAYTKLSHTISHDESNQQKQFFSETEFAIGVNYQASEKYTFFVELADSKQSFEQNDSSQWHDYVNIYRVGLDIDVKGYKETDFNFALEHRDGIESDIGYSTSISWFERTMSISYTDVGNYELLSFNFNAAF